jgi:hypothetical protein
MYENKCTQKENGHADAVTEDARSQGGGVVVGAQDKVLVHAMGRTSAMFATVAPQWDQTFNFDSSVSPRLACACVRVCLCLCESESKLASHGFASMYERMHIIFKSLRVHRQK